MHIQANNHSVKTTISPCLSGYITVGKSIVSLKDKLTLGLVFQLHIVIIKVNPMQKKEECPLLTTH